MNQRAGVPPRMKRIPFDARERLIRTEDGFLHSLDWTPRELRLYAERIEGISLRHMPYRLGFALRKSRLSP